MVIYHSDGLKAAIYASQMGAVCPDTTKYSPNKISTIKFEDISSSASEPIEGVKKLTEIDKDPERKGDKTHYRLMPSKMREEEHKEKDKHFIKTLEFQTKTKIGGLLEKIA